MTIDLALTVQSKPVVINFPGGPGTPLGGLPVVNAPAGDYTFAVTDGTSKGTFVEHTGTDANVYTFAPNSVVPIPLYEVIMVVNGRTAGALTIQQDTSDGDVMATDGTGATTSIVLPACTTAYFFKAGPKELRAYPGH